MEKIISKIVVSVVVLIMFTVNLFAISINTCTKVLNTVEEKGTYVKGFHTYSNMKSGYDEEVEKVIANKLIKSNSNVFIFDIDETVLNNFIGQFIYKSEGEDIYNSQWIKKDRLTLGLKHPELVVKKHIKRAIKQLLKDNKKVYFVTNTESHFKKQVDETISKLLDIENPQILYKSRICTIENDWKYKRFQEIADKENIDVSEIVFTGDDIKDFPDLDMSKFGSQYFLVPQKMYGIQFIYYEKYQKYIKKEVK